MEQSNLIDEGISLTNIEKIVIGVLWFLIEVIGGLLLLGLIQYERFGGDPLKRRIIDQVLISNLRIRCSNVTYNFGLF